MTQPVRSVRAKLEADASGYKRALVDATKVTADLANEVNRVGSLATQKASEVAKAAQEQEAAQQRALAAAERVGRGMVIAGAGIAAGIGLAVNAAIDWETAWAGVAKTVNGTEAELAALEGELRQLATELPATHGEIAAVAEAAGQLGVATGDIVSFTRTMIDLGETTNLTADEAATSIAQLMNVMGTAPEEVGNLGSALVELGNNGASTERDIIQMAQRIAGAGSIVGATETDVLALANALASAGIEVEAGGSAISKVLVNIATAVQEGGEGLENFAEVAGLSAREFARQFAADPVAALNMFIQGLGRMNTAGQDVFGTLDQLSLSEVRTRDALLRLASSGDLLSQSLSDGARAWDENLALTAEAEKRYGTTAAQLSIARNQLNDFAIDMGETFLPMLSSAASGVGELTELLGELPGPIKASLAVTALLTAGLLLAGGAALIAVPRLVAFKASLDTIAASGGRAAAGVAAFRVAASGVGSFLTGPWGVALGAAVVAVTAFAASQAQARARAQEFTDTLDQQTGAVTDDTRALVAHKLEEQGALEIAQRHGIELSTLVDAVLGNAAARRELSAAVRENAEVTEIHGQGITKTTGDVVTMDDVVKELTGDLDAGTAAWAREAEAVGTAGDAIEEANPATRQLAEALQLTADEATDLTDQVKNLEDALNSILGFMFGVEEAQDAAARALRDVTEAAKENGTALEGNSEAALENRDNLRSLIQADFDLVQALAEAGASSDELATETEKLKQKFIEQMRQAGFSEEAVEEYAKAYDQIPSAVSTSIKTPGMTQAEKDLRNLKAGIDRIPRNVNVNINVTQPRTLPGTGGLPNVGFRHGGITMHAQTGLLRMARIFPPVAPARFAFAEPATGGEAFIPRLGNRARSLAIADTAASWHGGAVVPASLATAATDLLRHLNSGGTVAEDFSFRGMPNSLSQFNDQLADQFYGLGSEFERSAVTNFLEGISSQAQTPSSGGVGGRFQWHGQRNLLTGGDGASAAEPTNVTYNVYPQRADFTIQDLDALQRRQDALARVNRPR